MSKANDKELGALHGSLAGTLADAIREGELVLDKEGQPIIINDKPLRKPASASLLSVARQFLKDNHIEAGLGNKDTNALDQALKDMQSLPYDGEIPAEFKQ